MHATLILGALAAATGVFAQNLPRMALANPTAVADAGIAARDVAGCSRVVVSIVPMLTSDMPIPPSSVADYLASTSVTVTNPCVDPIITGEVGTAYSSYATQYSSWWTKHLADLQTLWKECSDVPQFSQLIFTGSECSTLVAQITGGTVGTTSKPNAGPRETGMVAAAALAAGFVVAAGY